MLMSRSGGVGVEVFVDEYTQGHNTSFLECQPRAPRSSGTPRAVSTPDTQLLISNTILY